MGRGGRATIGPFRSAIAQWKFVGGAIDREGNVVGKPAELVEAEMIVGLCRQFGCLPSQLLAEDVSFLRMLNIAALGMPDGE